MAKEIRKLILSAHEVEAAIGLYLDAAKADARSQHIRSVKVQHIGLGISADVELSITLPGGRSEITLKADQLGAAIILYCKKARIPLPKNGTKLLSLDEDGVSMGIKLG